MRALLGSWWEKPSAHTSRVESIDADFFVIPGFDAPFLCQLGRNAVFLLFFRAVCGVTRLGADA
jgi:hypothetical protein